MMPMLRKALWDLRWTTLWFGLGMGLYTLAMILYFPSIQNSIASIKAMLEANRQLMQAFGVTDISTLSGYLGSYILNVIWPLVIGGFAVMAGSAVVAKEIESGTVEEWLALPASRIRLLGAKLVAVAIACLVVVAATLAAVWLGALIVHQPLSTSGLFAMAAVMVGFALAIAGVSSLISAVINDRGQAAGIAAGLMVASYLVWVIGGMADGWHWLQNLSIFTAYEPQRALETSNVQLGSMAIMIAIALIGGMLALAAFARRDAIS